jgi:hypothetical protein
MTTKEIEKKGSVLDGKGSGEGGAGADRLRSDLEYGRDGI